MILNIEDLILNIEDLGDYKGMILNIEDQRQSGRL